MDTNMEVNFSNTNPVAETLRLQPPSWLVLTQSGISINLSSGEVIIPENLELSAASREFWNSVSNLAKTRISEMRLGTDSAIRILEDIKSAINHAGRSYLLEVEGNLISLITINLRQQDRRIAELEAQLAAEKQTWRCFHCGFETSDKTEASGHFGEFGEEYPLCIHWSDLDADGKASEFQSINAELEGEREENLKLRQQVEQLEYLTGSQEADISSRFKGCRTINEAFFKYDSMEGRALAAEERIAALEAALQVAREALETIRIGSGPQGNWQWKRSPALRRCRVTDQLTLAEMRSRLEDLLSDLHQLESIPPLQRIGNASVHIGTGERWILDLASEALAQREREEMEDSNG